MANKQPTLKGKLIITATLRLVTGLHIGASKEFAAIGAVDSPFIRDALTNQPIIPGSSIKGKMRTLLAKVRTDGYVLNPIDKDDETIKNLFGSTANNEARAARLQFYDIFLTEKSYNKLIQAELDTYIGEIKFENSISRTTAVANPRQIERVPAGAEFAFKLIYNIETAKEELDQDITAICEGLELLQFDYLGGSGSRGYGKIAFDNFNVEVKTFGNASDIDREQIKQKLEGIKI